MPGFRRAQLRGSDELFRSTEEPGPAEPPLPEPPVHPVPTAPTHNLRSVRLSEEDIQLLAEAVQHLKFPGKTPARPSIGRLRAPRGAAAETAPDPVGPSSGPRFVLIPWREGLCPWWVRGNVPVVGARVGRRDDES